MCLRCPRLCRNTCQVLSLFPLIPRTCCGICRGRSRRDIFDVVAVGWYDVLVCVRHGVRPLTLMFIACVVCFNILYLPIGCTRALIRSLSSRFSWPVLWLWRLPLCRAWPCQSILLCSPYSGWLSCAPPACCPTLEAPVALRAGFTSVSSRLAFPCCHCATWFP